MLNFLHEKLITARTLDGRNVSLSLPGVLAGLATGEVASFKCLRSHQRHIWHALLVQLATLSLEKAGESALPNDETTWAGLISNLTPEWPDGEPWSLVVSDPRKPAFMQAPNPSGDLSSFRRIETPDGLDILITAKNHDLKAERMWRCQPEDWLFALVSLQTQEGIMGGGKYGVSRMNGGYGSRCMLGIDFPGSPGFRFRRDVTILRSLAREEASAANPSAISLVWLEPWDGKVQIPFEKLHPYYIEICRRIRLTAEGPITALETTSGAPRISAADLKGNTGDPWTPISVEGKAISASREGFSYRKLADILNPSKYKLPVLAKPSGNDPAHGAVLVVQAVSRGQGKTEGLHERVIPFPNLALSHVSESQFSELVEERAAALNELRIAFRFALFALAQGGQRKISPENDATKKFVIPCIQRLERGAGETFFEDLMEEVRAPEPTREDVRQQWLRNQLKYTEKALSEARQELPQPLARRYQAQARAMIAFRTRLAKAPQFQFMFPTLANTGIPEDAGSSNGYAKTLF